MWYYANSKAEAEALEVPAFLSCGHIFLAGEGPCLFTPSPSSLVEVVQHSGTSAVLWSCGLY